MHRKEQHMFLLIKLQQRDPKHRPSRKIERTSGFFFHQSFCFYLTLIFWMVGQIHERDNGWPERRDSLHGAGVNHAVSSAQHLVASHNLVDRPLKGRDVKQTQEVKRNRYVVGRAAWAKLVNQPQSLLRERERKGVERLALLF